MGWIDGLICDGVDRCQMENRFNHKLAQLEEKIATIAAGKEKVKERYDAGVVRNASFHFLFL